MARSWSVDEARNESVLSSGAGFPFLLCFGITWILCAGVSFAAPLKVAAWVYLLQGVVSMPVAFLMHRAFRYPKASPDNPLTPLALQLVFIQPVAFPVFILVLDIAPHYVPAAFAAVVGAHFLPFSWMHKTNVYTVLGIVVSAGAFGLAIALGRRSFHYTGFFVGAALLVGAFLVRAHAKALAQAR
jgi:hypothetical protein